MESQSGIEGVEMLPIATEVLTITEQEPGHYVSLVNDEFFAARRIKDPTPKLKAMLLLARNKLLNEISQADRTRKIEHAVHRSFKSTVFSASFLLDDDADLIFLTYFGERVDPETSYIDGLIHVLEVVEVLEADLNGGGSIRRPPSRSSRGAVATVLPRGSAS